MAPAVKIFFWSEELKPEDYVRKDIASGDRQALASILRNGKVIVTYRGMAKCRIPDCPRGIGNSDMGGHGFIWPGGCEHYVLEHSVWPPGATELLTAGSQS